MSKELATIFTRHQLTLPQLKEIESLGYELVFSESLAVLAKKTLKNVNDAEIIVGELIKIVRENSGRLAIFGVFPPIFRSTMYELNGSLAATSVQLITWESHNINRTPEGEPPQFQHERWIVTGYYFVEPEDITIN